MRIGIIGASSFCGRKFLEYCLARNHVCIATYRTRKLEGCELATWYRFNLAYEAENLAAMLAHEACEIVVNFAAESMVAESWTYPAAWYQTNVANLATILERIRKDGIVKKFIHFSTPEVYGNTTQIVNEDRQWSPSTPYAVSRLAADMHLKALFKAYGFPMMITRASNVYGIGQQGYRLIPKAIACALAGKAFPLDGTGHAVRAWIHERDMCEALMTVIEKGTLGETYHLTNMEYATTAEVVQMAYDVVGAACAFEQKPARLGQDTAYMLNGSKVEALGFTAKVSLFDGLREIIAWAKHRGSSLHEPVCYSPPLQIDQDQVSVG